MKITADLIVSLGLVAALILCIVLGRSDDIVSNISVGLVGWLGKVMYTTSQAGKTPAKEAPKEEAKNDSRI